jgi:hypothetical protein
MKRRKYFLIASVLLLSSTLTAEEQNPQSNPNGETKTPSTANDTLPPKKPLIESSSKADAKSNEKLDAFLGGMKPILEKATKVEAYLINPKKPSESVPEENQLGGYLVQEGPVVLGADQLKQIKNLVLSEKSYFWGPPHKKCLIVPIVALRFIKAKEEVSVLLSTYCNMWTFAYQGKADTRDYAPVAGAVNQLLSTLFPTEFSNQPTQQ